MSKSDAYDLVTGRIIEALEAGIVPWHRPWKTGPNAGPISLSTGKPYQGINVWVLEATAALRGYESRYWVTFNQARERGGNVRKGEKGTPVVFWKFIEKKNPANPDKPERIPFLRHFTVFNIDQCDNVNEPVRDFEPEPFEPIERAEAIAAAMPSRPNVKHGGDRACYSPVLDYVQMPLTVQFESPEAYYGTLFHELVHSTGHESRLARKTLSDWAPFGSEDYSKEELVAEMGAAFLCGAAGIDVNVAHHAGYIASWLRVLKDDHKMVVSAAGAAQKAANYVLGATANEEGSHAEPSDLGHSHPRRKSQWTDSLTCPAVTATPIWKWPPSKRPATATGAATADTRRLTSRPYATAERSSPRASPRKRASATWSRFARWTPTKSGPATSATRSTAGPGTRPRKRLDSPKPRASTSTNPGSDRDSGHSLTLGGFQDGR